MKAICGLDFSSSVSLSPGILQELASCKGDDKILQPDVGTGGSVRAVESLRGSRKRDSAPSADGWL